jgi:hypothetical protein
VRIAVINVLLGEKLNDKNLSRIKTHQGSSEREFGLVFSAFFMILAVFDKFSKLPFTLDVPYLKDCVFLQDTEWVVHPLTLVFGMLSLCFLLFALFLPNLLMPLNWLWTKLGLLLHKIVSPIVLGLLFYVVFTPIGVVMRLLGSDLLRLRIDKGATSYWIERTPAGPEPTSLEDQF